MVARDGKIQSLADCRITIPPTPGYVWRSSSGIWLGTTIEYVQQYYGSYDPDDPEEMSPGEYEIRCTFEYDPKHIISGPSIQGTNDNGSEFVVSELTLIQIYNVTKGELYV